jgi:hypothetical protein
MIASHYEIVLISWIVLGMNGVAHARHISTALDENLLSKQRELNYIMEKLQGN